MVNGVGGFSGFGSPMGGGVLPQTGRNAPLAFQLPRGQSEGAKLNHYNALVQQNTDTLKALGQQNDAMIAMSANLGHPAATGSILPPPPGSTPFTLAPTPAPLK